MQQSLCCTDVVAYETVWATALRPTIAAHVYAVTVTTPQNGVYGSRTATFGTARPMQYLGAGRVCVGAPPLPRCRAKARQLTLSASNETFELWPSSKIGDVKPALAFILYGLRCCSSAVI